MAYWGVREKMPSEDWEEPQASTRVSHFNLWSECGARGHELQGKKQGAIIYRPDRESKVSEMFIVFPGNWSEPESKPRSQAVPTLEYGPLNQPITAHIVSKRCGQVIIQWILLSTL